MKKKYFNQIIVVCTISALIYILCFCLQKLQNYDAAFGLTLTILFLFVLTLIFGFKEIDLKNFRIKR